MSIIKLARNLKQMLRPIQRNKKFVGAMAGIGAVGGATVGNAASIETDVRGNVKTDKYGNVQHSKNRGRNVLIGAGIGGLLGGASGTRHAVRMDRDINLPHAKFMRAIKSDTRKIQRDRENFRKSFGERSFDNDFKYERKTGGFGDSFKRSQYSAPKPPPAPDYEDFDSFFKKFKQEYSYNTTPPPPRMKMPKPSPHESFFKEHGNINHTDITTKKQAKNIYREAARKHHPDMGGNEETFKKVSTDWENIQNGGWFNKLAMIIKSAQSKWRPIAKKILERGAATKTEKKLVDMLHKPKFPTSNDRLVDFQRKLRDQALRAEKSTGSKEVRDFHHQSALHHFNLKNQLEGGSSGFDAKKLNKISLKKAV